MKTKNSGNWFFFNSFFLLLENFFFCPLWWLMMGWAPGKKDQKNRNKTKYCLHFWLFVRGYWVPNFLRKFEKSSKMLHELKIKEVRRHLGFVILFKPILRFWFTEIITNVAYFWMMMVAFSRYFFIPKNRNSPFFTISRHDNLNLYRKIASLVTWCLGFYMKIQTWPPFLSGRLLLELGGKN